MSYTGRCIKFTEKQFKLQLIEPITNSMIRIRLVQNMNTFILKNDNEYFFRSLLVWYFWYLTCNHQVIKKYIFDRQLKWNFWLLSEDNKLFKTVGVHTQWWLASIEKSLESWLVVIYKNRVIKYNDIDFASVFYMILKFNIDLAGFTCCVDLITDY